MSSSAIPSCAVGKPLSEMRLMEKINGPWHKWVLQSYIVIVLAHWAEHLAQAYQIYVLNWPIPEARGVLGLWFPWLVSSESLHYVYAIVMLAGLWFYRTGFVGRAYLWWMIAFWIQFWHHIEHGVLLGQAIVGANLLGGPVPVSFVQIWIPRVELHLFYNTVVFFPMIVGMYYHMFPTAAEHSHHRCSCAWGLRASAPQ